ncbi:MAG: hypothetical protein HC899_27095 [Leptolyngbyaceae cyanobacterium SM1_4_3]|nr:hypothetical protein [Leptolyngbyaceae cyanobacterium SM1_4_3]
MNKLLISTAVPLKDVDQDTAKWVQAQLVTAGYLPADDRDHDGVADNIDGLIGDRTLKAFAEFKQDFYLEYPDLLGASTIDFLANAEPKQVAEGDNAPTADDQTAPTAVNPDAGSKTGASATLPKVGLVYENEFVVPGTYITWGEMTKGLKRIPIASTEFGSAESVVLNMIELATVFGKIRTKFGSPIAVTSGYRPPNLKIGAKQSQHKYGRGLDLRPLNDDFMTLLETIKAVPEVQKNWFGGTQERPLLAYRYSSWRSSSQVLFLLMAIDSANLLLSLQNR